MTLDAVTIRRLLVVGLLVTGLPPWFASAARADDALVLPKGRARVTLDNLFYLTAEKRFNPHGNTEDVASFFNNRRLDSSVFSLLSPLNPFVGGSASIGDSQVKFKYDYDILDLGGQYGLTDRLTVGIDIPYYWVENHVKAVLNSGPGSSANVGINPSPSPLARSQPVIPLSLGGRRLTTEDVQELLGHGLVVPSGTRVGGFGFKRVQDWSGDGLGDIIVGAKYQYLKTEDWALAATGGVRFPTGRQDDPDDLVDIQWTSGAYAILFRLHNDFTVSNLWNRRPPAEARTPDIAQPGDLVLDATVRYDWVLPDFATVRVSGDVSNPITTNRERVYRNLGDKVELEFGGKYYLFGGFYLSALYRYGFKETDSIVGHRGFAYQTLRKDTDSTEQIYIVGVSYSTLPLFLEKKFPVPLGVSLYYRDRFAGTGPRNAASPSQILNTQYIGLGLQVLF